MAILIIGLIYVGFNLDELKIWNIHKSLGILALMLVVLRLLWKMKNVNPKMPKDTSKGVQKAASGMHHLLYLVMIAMPISGIIMSIAGGRDASFFGLFSISKLAEKDKVLAEQGHMVHEYLAYFICTLIILHILGALYHHFTLKDNILTRMLPFGGDSSEAKE
jgi:cytochrome b561